MAMIKREGEEEKPAVEMIPLIDMVFLLLIFFLVTASLKKPHKELAIRLPTAGYAKLAKYEKEGQFIISITRNGTRFLDDGKEFLNQAPVSRDELVQALYRLSREKPDVPIRLDIDRNVRWWHVMDMADTLELYGLRNVQLRSQHGPADETR